MRWFIEADVSMRNSRMGIFSLTPVSVPTRLALLPSLLRTATRTLNSRRARTQGARGDGEMELDGWNGSWPPLSAALPPLPPRELESVSVCSPRGPPPSSLLPPLLPPPPLLQKLLLKHPSTFTRALAPD